MHYTINTDNSELVNILLRKVDGRLVIPFLEAAKVAGYPQQTARNELSRGVFPIKTVKRGRLRFIIITDLVEYFRTLQGIEETLAPPPLLKRPCGRPRKLAGQEGGGV